METYLVWQPAYVKIQMLNPVCESSWIVVLFIRQRIVVVVIGSLLSHVTLIYLSLLLLTVLRLAIVREVKWMWIWIGGFPRCHIG